MALQFHGPRPRELSLKSAPPEKSFERKRSAAASGGVGQRFWRAAQLQVRQGAGRSTIEAMRRLTKALGLVSVLAMTSPAIGQETCLFLSHQIDPANPGPSQSFSVTVTVLASCVAYYPPEVASNVVTVDVECSCPIPLPPPPILWTHSFVVSGLPAGAATVEFVDHLANPPSLFYSFGLVVGSAIDIPSIEGRGAVFLAFILLASGMVLLSSRR